jgi:hypothetical protein
MALWLISFLALSNHFIGNNLATNSVKYLVASIPNDSVLHGNEVMDFADVVDDNYLGRLTTTILAG